MNPRERGYLLLSSRLGNPDRKPLSTAQLRLLAQRAAYLPESSDAEELTMAHLISAGIEKQLAERILNLLEDSLQLEAYLSKARRLGCTAITRASGAYPVALRKRLGLDAPGCLWAKGDRSILHMPAVSLVGSRDLLHDGNRKFARQVGAQAARQGYALISGNARGADSVAQAACLEAGGYVVSVLADSLEEHCPGSHQLFLSEDDFDELFSAPRALHRNRVIHAMGDVTFVAQCALGRGGTWDGSVQNLHRRWTPLYCFRDGSAASAELEQMGACLIAQEALTDFSKLPNVQLGFI